MMNGSNVVVVPLDGSEFAKQSIPTARVLAGESGKIVFLRVIPHPHSGDSSSSSAVAVVTPEVINDWVWERAEQDLYATAFDVQNEFLPTVTIETRVAAGDTAEVIRDTATSCGANLIVITSHARGAIGRVAFGSVADRLTRTSLIPVVIVRPADGMTSATQDAFKRLLVPIDGSERGRPALAMAKALARQLNLPVRLLRVIDFSPSMYMGAPFPFPQEYFDDVRSSANASLAEAAQAFAGTAIPITTEVREGSPAIEIESACEVGDLIVLTSHGRSGIERWLLGSVAEKLVRFAPVPVCLVPSTEPARAETATHTEAVIAFAV